jgi:hypothetical protein
MAQRIHNYATDRLTLGDDDYFDIDFFNGTAYQTAKIKGSVIKQASGGLYGLYSQTSASTPIVSTAIETSMFQGATSQGSLMVPANGFAVGDAFHCKLGGYIDSINNTDVEIRIKSNGTTILAESGLIQLPAMTQKVFEIELDFVIRSIGGTGSAEVLTMGEINYVQNSGTSFEGYNFCTSNNTTFDTTISNMLDITWEWKTATSQNSVTTDIANLRKTY